MKNVQNEGCTCQGWLFYGQIKKHIVYKSEKKIQKSENTNKVMKMAVILKQQQKRIMCMKHISIHMICMQV